MKTFKQFLTEWDAQFVSDKGIKIDLIKFERENLYVNTQDRITLCVDGRWYDIIEDFFKPKGNALQNIRILDEKLRGLASDTTVINISNILDISGGRKGISMKAVLTKLLNNFKEVVRDDAEMYYNHIEAILQFLDYFNEGKRQAKLMKVDDDVAQAWAPALGKL
jgi:hypothetical protein